MNAHRRIDGHTLIGTEHTYRADLPPYDPSKDDEPGLIVLGNGERVTVLAAFHDWNGVDGLDMLYVHCHVSGLSTHATPADLGIAGPLLPFMHDYCRRHTCPRGAREEHPSHA